MDVTLTDGSAFAPVFHSKKEKSGRYVKSNERVRNPTENVQIRSSCSVMILCGCASLLWEVGFVGIATCRLSGFLSTIHSQRREHLRESEGV